MLIVTSLQNDATPRNTCAGYGLKRAPEFGSHYDSKRYRDCGMSFEMLPGVLSK